jgi:rRNA-processing protein FCF1
MSSIVLTANFSVATGDFPCWGKTHCALNATHRCAVIHKTRGLREKLHNYVVKQSCSPICTQSGLLDSVLLSYVGLKTQVLDSKKFWL